VKPSEANNHLNPDEQCDHEGIFRMTTAGKTAGCGDVAFGFLIPFIITNIERIITKIIIL